VDIVLQIKKEHKFWLICISLISLFFPMSVLAEEQGDKWLNWQDTSITGLYGGKFEVDPSDQATVTLEHASDWSFGDMYMFLDGTRFSHGDRNGKGDRDQWYGEATVRLSIDKLTDTDFHFSIFQQDLVIFEDILFAASYERGRDRDATESILLGVGFDFDLSAFSLIGLNKLKYFQVNVYARNDVHSDDTGFEDYQITVVTAFPFQIGKAKFLADGYIDYVFGKGPQHANFHLNPQIKLDLGNFYGNPDKLFVGVEIDYWRNKYGIKDSSGFDTNQCAVSGIIKYHF
jgi:nucleoside-specific outer membrane channel protein Tsx